MTSQEKRWLDENQQNILEVTKDWMRIIIGCVGIAIGVGVMIAVPVAIAAFVIKAII